MIRARHHDERSEASSGVGSTSEAKVREFEGGEVRMGSVKQWTRLDGVRV